MVLQVTYRYRNQVPEESLRRSEGIKVKRRFPAKIPVSVVVNIIISGTVQVTVVLLLWVQILAFFLSEKRTGFN